MPGRCRWCAGCTTTSMRMWTPASGRRMMRREWYSIPSLVGVWAWVRILGWNGMSRASWGEMGCPENPGVGAWAGPCSRAEVGCAWTQGAMRSHQVLSWEHWGICGGDTGSVMELMLSLALPPALTDVLQGVHHFPLRDAGAGEGFLPGHQASAAEPGDFREGLQPSLPQDLPGTWEGRILTR